MRIWYDPVTVNREFRDIYVTVRVVARVGRHPWMMILSQETCLQKDTMLHLRRMGGVVSFWYVCPYLFRYGLFLYKSDEVGLLQMRDRISGHLSLRICVHAPQGQ